ncbi:MAG TPA: protein kinase [Thermoanaerobaculia bacterium]|nr:protein kinase [Thermoanaerobaculia bacterium]
MSSTPATGPYRVGERIGTSLWKGSDTRNGKPVALKILSKQLPKDQAKRDTLLREVRVASALYHAFLVPIIEIVPLGENLVMAMTWLEVLPITKYINHKAMARTDCLHLSYQLADGVKFLHTKGVVHGNINGDSVMVTPDGQIKLGGLNLTNLISRGDGISAAYQQKGSDARSVAYMASEQIVGQPVDPKTDVYSIAVVMYEMATGRLPYDAATAPDFARKIVEGQPMSPAVVNPSIDKGILAILGRCLYKDQFRRLKDAKALVDEITKAEPDAMRFANELVSKSAPATAATATQDAAAKQAILFVGDVANYDELAAADPEKASQTAARMQQLLGEAVYLFDGKVLDPFGKKMIAEMPSVESALEAARKGEFDFSPDQQSGEPISVRLLLHFGAVAEKDGNVSGDGVKRAVQVLAQLPPDTLHLTEDFLKRGRAGVRVRDAGAKGGVKVFTIAPSELPVPKAPPEPTAAELEAEEAAEAEAEMEVIAADAAKRRNRTIAISAAAVVVLLIIAGGIMMMRSGSHPQVTTAPLTRKTTRTAPQQAAVLINPINVEGNDPVLVDRANAIRLAATEILRHVTGVRLAETPAADVAPFGATLRAGAAGPELVPQQAPATPIAVPDAASGIRAILAWASSQAHVPIRDSQSPEALNAYADAVTAWAANDPTKAETSIKAAVTADPSFLPAQLLAMRYYSAKGDAPHSVEAAKQVMALDSSNMDAARMVARTLLSLGDVPSSFAAYKVILHNDAGDVEALTHIARYAASIGDAARFNAARERLRRVPASTIAVHDGDVLAAAGRLELAVKQYYAVEEQVQNNPALSLKIGRIAVLMQSLPIADIELGKLQQTDPVFGYHLLKAYIAAHQKSAADAEQELKAASDASTPGDNFWTSAAEVYVLLGENDKVLESLEKAVARKEPTSSLILSDPLFEYLKADERFDKIRAAASAEQQDISTALAQIVI